MCGISRRWADDTRLSFEKTKYFGHCIAETVKEYDVIPGYLVAPPLVYLIGKELPCGGDALGCYITIGLVLGYQVYDNIFDPLGNLFPFLNGITDILPGDVNAQSFQIVCYADDLSDFVGKLFSPFMNDKSSHCCYPLFGSFITGIS